MRRINALYFKKCVFMLRNLSLVNSGDDEEEKPSNSGDEVKVVRNRYDDDSVDQPISEGDVFDGDGDGNDDDERRYDDPSASDEYDPDLSTEFVADAEAGADLNGRMELDSRPPDGVSTEYMADGVRGEVVISGNDTGARIGEVFRDDTVFEPSLAEIVSNPSAEKVLSIRNARGKEFAIFLVASDAHNGGMGSVVYDRRVFFDGKEVPLDHHDMLDFDNFDPKSLDDTLVTNMFGSFGNLVKSDLAALKIDVEMWLGLFASESASGIEKMPVDDLLETLKINFSELSKVGCLVGVGEFFAKMMSDTPMHNMITHMVQGPCRGIDGAIAYLMDAQNTDDVKDGLSMLHRSVERLFVIATEFLPLIAKHGVAPHAVNLSEIAMKLKRGVGDDEVRSRVEVDINPEIVGVFSEAFILPILENAVFNAVKFGGDVRISAEQDNDGVFFRIHDNAPDMPEEVRACLFRKPVDPARPVVEGIDKGSGMGSFVAGKIIEDMRATPGMPNADEYNIEFVQESGLKYFSLRMPAYGYKQAVWINGLRNRNDDARISAAA